MDPLTGAAPELRAWRVLDELVLAVYRATRVFPGEEREVLLPALRRTAVAAAVCLAAGESSGGPPGRAVAAATARLTELRYYLYLARRLRLIDALAYRGLTGQHERCLRALERLHRGGIAPGAGSMRDARPREPALE